MKIFTVFVKDSMGKRFIDTSWAVFERAEERKSQILVSMSATKFDGSVCVVEMEVEDLQLATVAQSATVQTAK